MTLLHISDYGARSKTPVSPCCPWPLVASLSALLMAVGMVLMMHKVTPWLLPAGFSAVLLSMFLWWRDVVRESNTPGIHTSAVQVGLKYGVSLFIASEVMFFVAFFWSYFDNAFFPKGGVWPPAGIKTFNPFELPFLNTLILLLSGCTVTWAHYAIVHNDRRGFINGLLWTVLLGIVFLCCQAYEYSHAAFGFKDGVYASTFYMATGFHGFHVLIGTLFLAVCLIRARKGHFTPEQHVGFESAAWYWHFVDVVWLFLFISIYVFGS
jgi:cytochrome c oxidase subunit III